MLQQFLQSNYVRIDGYCVPFHRFVRTFQDFLFAGGVNPADWPASRIRDELESIGLPVGSASYGLAIGNLLSLADSKKRYVKIDKYQLRKERITA